MFRSFLFGYLGTTPQRKLYMLKLTLPFYIASTFGFGMILNPVWVSFVLRFFQGSSLLGEKISSSNIHLHPIPIPSPSPSRPHLNIAIANSFTKWTLSIYTGVFGAAATTAAYGLSADWFSSKRDMAVGVIEATTGVGKNMMWDGDGDGNASA